MVLNIMSTPLSNSPVLNSYPKHHGQYYKYKWMVYQVQHLSYISSKVILVQHLLHMEIIIFLPTMENPNDALPTQPAFPLIPTIC